jgi:hypothetical protein
MDGGVTYDREVEMGFTVTTALAVVKSYTDPYTNLKVQVKSKVVGEHGILSCKYLGVWF